MEFLSMDDVVDLHDDIIARYGGASGMLHRGGLESALARCHQGPFPREPNVFARAALLLRGITQDHPFVDGNKRTAFHATFVFLQRNGWTVTATGQAIDQFMVNVALGKHSPNSIRDWLIAHAKNNTEVN